MLDLSLFIHVVPGEHCSVSHCSVSYIPPQIHVFSFLKCKGFIENLNKNIQLNYGVQVSSRIYRAEGGESLKKIQSECTHNHKNNRRGAVSRDNL